MHAIILILFYISIRLLDVIALLIPVKKKKTKNRYLIGRKTIDPINDLIEFSAY